MAQVRLSAIKASRAIATAAASLLSKGEVAVADQTAHLAVADPNCEAPQPHPARARCGCTRLAAADLKRVTSGGSSLGNGFRRSLRRPSFDVVPAPRNNLQSITTTSRSSRPPTTSPVPTVCIQNTFCPSVATVTLAASTAPRGGGGDIITNSG